MINYQILTGVSEKNRYKTRIFSLFNHIFNKELKESEWSHFFLNSPYENSLLILALSADKVVGIANLIPQKLNIGRKKYNYYLFITSAVLKSFRSEGVYMETIKIIKNILKNKEKDFIFAFPNKNAYPLLTELFYFIPLKRKEIVNVNNFNLKELKPVYPERSIFLDDQFVKWRFEHKHYFYIRHNGKCIIYKGYKDSLDVIEIIESKYENIISRFISIKNDINPYSVFNVLKNRLLSPGNKEYKVGTTVSPCYFSFDTNLDLSKLDISLLMSDVF